MIQSYQDDPNSYVGSFPKEFSYGPFEQNGEGDNTSLSEDHKPRILLMGLRRLVLLINFSVVICHKSMDFITSLLIF